ncbi:MAG: hypothetical protein KKD31_11795 [Bacteroidetes bacterium]|nr:hypothetical protein [Bacteroidota bacterium]
MQYYVKILKLFILVFASATLMLSCATVLTDQKKRIFIDSGRNEYVAFLYDRNDNLLDSCITPCQFSMKGKGSHLKRAANYIVIKKGENKEVKLNIEMKITPVFFLNFLGGFGGILIDMMTGCMWRPEHRVYKIE